MYNLCSKHRFHTAIYILNPNLHIRCLFHVVHMYAVMHTLCKIFVKLCGTSISLMSFSFVYSGVIGSVCSSATDVQGYDDALSVLSIAVVKWSLAKVQSGRLNSLSSTPSLITPSQPHLLAVIHSYTSLLPFIILSL